MSLKEKLEILKSLSQSFAALAIPVVVAYMGWSIQAEMKSSEVRKDYVQMALGIMSSPAETDDQKLLRAWATRVISDSSPTPFRRDEIHALQERQIRVYIPTPVPCRAPEVVEPAWAAASLKSDDDLDTKVHALLAERQQHLGYEAQLRAAVMACQ